MSRPHIRRREAAAIVAMPWVPWVWGAARAQTAPTRRATPAQTEGPFYPVNLPKDTDFDLLRNGALNYTHGQPAWVEGTLTDLQGKPIAGAQVEIWQCDESGHYHHPGDGGRADPAFQGFGRVVADAQGAWRFRTIRPAPYSGRTPHIHFKVKLAGTELLTTQLYVEGDPHNPRDGLWRGLSPEARAAVTVPFVDGTDGLRARFPIIIAT